MTSVIKDDGKLHSQLFLEEEMYDELAKRKALKKDISEELMPVAWHPTRWWDWCLPEDEKEGTERIFTDEVGRC